MAELQRFKRLYPRRQVSTPCRVGYQNQQIMAKIVDVSYNGVGVVLPVAVDLTSEASVEIPKEIKLRVQPVYNRPSSSREEIEQYRIGFKIQLIEEGRRYWTNLCHMVHW